LFFEHEAHNFALSFAVASVSGVGNIRFAHPSTILCNFDLHALHMGTKVINILIKKAPLLYSQYDTMIIVDLFLFCIFVT